MSLRIHTIKAGNGTAQKRKRVGRGNASGHGTYSCRGLKGQRARSGGRKGLKLKGIKKIILSLPKYRGFKPICPPMKVVNLADLEKRFEEGAVITRKELLEKKLIGKNDRLFKLLGKGEVHKKFTVKADSCSQSAREAVEEKGGKVIIIGAK